MCPVHFVLFYGSLYERTTSFCPGQGETFLSQGGQVAVHFVFRTRTLISSLHCSLSHIDDLPRPF